MVGEYRGVTVIDDFAHHPTAVAGTLAALRAALSRDDACGRVFEPRSNTSRRRVFQHEYVAALAAADRVIVGGVFQKQSDAVGAEELFSPEQLVGDLRGRGVAADAIGSTDEIAASIARRGGARRRGGADVERRLRRPAGQAGGGIAALTPGPMERPGRMR